MIMNRTAKLTLSTLMAVAAILVSPMVRAAESQQAIVFYHYIRDLYYAKNLNQITKFWAKPTREPLEALKGQAAKYKLEELKVGYVYKPKINVQRMQGIRCLMKGTAIANDLGRTFPCSLDVIMIFEEGSWRIEHYHWSATINQ
jgi:hypothetical protein